jgi:hypothetical protein
MTSVPSIRARPPKSPTHLTPRNDTASYVERSAVSAAVLVVIAFTVYEPWRPAPFSILDFSEFLPLLQGTESLGERISALAAYYRSHGRFALLTYAYIALNWTLFGSASAGWEWARFGLMTFNVLLAFALLRRLTHSIFAAFLGAALFIVAAPAAGAWVRLTGEPLSLLALLSGALLASGYQQSADWPWRTAALVLLCTAAVAAKETSIVAAGVLIVFACSWDGPRGIVRPRMSSRNVWLLALSTAAMLMIIGAAVIGMSSVAADGYIRSYGEGTPEPLRLLTTFLVFVLPMPAAPGVVGLVTTVIFSILAVVGWNRRIRNKSTPVPYAELALLLALPMLGAAAYLPWPRLEFFYGLPFLFGSACVLAVAVAQLARQSRTHAVLVHCAGAIMIGLAATAASQWARTVTALHEINWQLVHEIGALHGAEPVLVATPATTPQEWQGTGATLRRFALAVGVAGDELPEFREVPCNAALDDFSPDRAASVLLISYAHQCGPLPNPLLSISRTVGHLDPARLRPARTTFQVDIALISAVGGLPGYLPAHRRGLTAPGHMPGEAAVEGGI